MKPILGILLLAGVHTLVQAQTTQTIALRQGWNLISFRVLPEPPTPARVLSGLSADPSTSVRSVWTYDPTFDRWLHWSPGSELGAASGPGIHVIEHFRGYWIDVALPNLTLTVVGGEATDGRIRFVPGWNLLGFPSGVETGPGLAQIDAVFRDHVQGPDPAVDLIYAIAADGGLRRWDFTIDRREGDFNADGVINAADEAFKFDFGLPDDDPALAESSPTPDDFVALLGGEGYWVHARRPFLLEPRLRLSLPADLDNNPVGNFPGPEDRDVDGDGLFDEASWSAPDEVGATVQSALVLEAGQKTSQILIQNAGTGILLWNVRYFPDATLQAIAPDALSLEPGSGQILTDTDYLTLSIDRTGLPPGRYRGDLEVASNGGSRLLAIWIEVAELVGDFRGIATINSVNGKSVTLPALDLAVSLFRSPDGLLRGQLRSDTSTHFPIPVSLQGHILTPGSSEFVSLGSYSLPANAVLVRAPNSLDFTLQEGPAADTLFDVDTINPFPRPVFRELIFHGDRTREDIGLTGEFFDTLTGIAAEPIVVRGHFELTRESLDPTVQPQAGRTTPCSIVLSANQQIPDATGAEKFFLLDGTLGCPPITNPVLIDQVWVYAQLQHPNRSQLRLRLLSPLDNPADPQAGVLLYDGLQPNAPTLQSGDLSWPGLFSDATQGLFPQAGPTALTDAYRGQRADQGDGVWRLGVTDRVADNSGGRLTRWTVAFVGPEVHALSGRVVDSLGAPIALASIAISGADTVGSITTGTAGRFVFPNLAPHRYRLSASKLGYRSSAQAERRVDLLADADVGDLVLTPLAVTDADLLISPAFGRLAPSQAGLASFTGTLRFIAPVLVPGDTYQFIIQRYAKATDEPDPGDPAFNANLRPPAPVGDPIRIPAQPTAESQVEFVLNLGGIYSVEAIVYRGGNEIGRVREPDPKPLERYLIQVEQLLPTGSSGGQPMMLAGSIFASGGVVPFDFYPPASPPGSNLDQPPPAFQPVGLDNPALADFTYRTVPSGPPQFQIRLGEDMARSVSVDWNGPAARPEFTGAPWDPVGDPWQVNNPDLNGTDLNVADPLSPGPANDFGHGPVPNVGWIAYGLLPGDGNPTPLPCPGASLDTPDRCFVLTSCVGSPVSGRSVGGGFSLSGGARLELLSSIQP
jgi:subtilisin-like proprotein convertase family protein